MPGASPPPLARTPSVLAAVLLTAWVAPGCGKKAPPERPLEPAYPVPQGISVLQSGSDMVLTWTLSRPRGEFRDLTVRECVVEALRLPPPAPEEWNANLARIAEGVGRDGMQPVGEVAVGLSSDSLGDRSWQFTDIGAATDAGAEVVYRVVCTTEAKGRGASSAVLWVRGGKAPPTPASLNVTPGPDGVRLQVSPGAGTPEDAVWRFYRLPLATGVTPAGPGSPLTARPSAEPALLDSTARLGADYEYRAGAVVRVGSSVRTMLREDDGPSPPLEALALRSATSLPPPAALEVGSPLSEAARLEYRDRFAPAMPSGLRALVDGSRVVLLWNPNDEPDLAGYRVYRKEEPGGPWAPLAGEPVTEAAYRDDQTRAGGAYSYSVSAMDRTDPPNESARTEPVSVIVPVR